MGQVAGAAGGIASAFTASFTATSALLDALGVFEDKYKTVATPDDPQAKADNNLKLQQQADNDVRMWRKRLAGYRQTRAQFGRFYRENGRALDLDALIPQAEAELRGAEAEAASRRGEHVATKLAERDTARGTDALDDLYSSLRAKQAFEAGLGRAGSVADAAPQVDHEVLREYGREAEDLTGASLAQAVSVLQEILREQQRIRALQERVRQPLSTSEPPPPIRAPRTGTTPR
jgi:hypothetical protein